jgi:hypothetical protein
MAVILGAVSFAVPSSATASTSWDQAFNPTQTLQAVGAESGVGAAAGPVHVEIQLRDTNAGGAVNLAEGDVRDAGAGFKQHLSWTGSIGPFELHITVRWTCYNATGTASTVVASWAVFDT